MLKNKRVFISGGAGVIGRELVKMLAKQDAIIMVGDLVPIPSDFPANVMYRRGDLNYITQQELNAFDPEVFFHLAATFERSTETYEHWEENFWHNIRLSNYLMTLMRNVPSLKRVVYASSYLIYDKNLYVFDSQQLKPIKLKETDPVSPRNLTGLAKLAHEIELEFLMQFRSDKFTSICARIYRGYGKNSRDIISRWVRDLMEEKEISIYRPEGWFDYIYAQDTAEGLLRLSVISDTGIVNLGTGKAKRVSEVVEVLKKHFPGMKSDYIESDILFEASEADTSKLEKLINWIPKRTIDDTIPEIIEYEKNKLSAPLKQKNVLITSISKKVPLINAVKKAVQKVNSSIMVFGGDSNPNCLGKFFVDSFWEMPSLNALSAENIIDYCHLNDIGLIIPTRDGELAFFSGIKNNLKENGIHVMVSDVKSTLRCIDKLEFSSIKSIYAIPASQNIEKLNATTFVVKERFGAGSVSIGINLTKSEAILHSEKLQNPLFQPFIKGKEISVDAYINIKGEFKGIIMRKRDLVVNGESQITTTFFNELLERKFIQIIETLSLYGHVVLQALIDENENIHLIECNPRFGGASTLALQAGLDSFYWAYLESLNISLDHYPFFKAQTEIKQIRSPHDIYL